MLIIEVKTYNSKEKCIDSCDMFFLDAAKEIGISAARDLMKKEINKHTVIDSNGYRLVYTRKYA